MINDEKLREWRSLFDEHNSPEPEDLFSLAMRLPDILEEIMWLREELRDCVAENEKLRSESVAQQSEIAKLATEGEQGE